MDRIRAALREWRVQVGILVAVFLVAFPFLVSDFWVTEIASKSLWMGIIALSLIFLVKYGGMISLAQLATAGLAGYTVAYATFHGSGNWALGVVLGVFFATLGGLFFGLISVRTEGIYLLMITLALGLLVFFFANQNCEIFNCHRGIGPVKPPQAGPLDLTAPHTFYFVSLVVAALVYGLVRYVSRSRFGLSLQGIRDNPRRMRALGYRVGLHKVMAFGFAGFIAGLGGVLMVWHRVNMSPPLIDLTRNIDILIVAIVGGVIYAEGAFIGAVFFNLADTFTAEFFTRERFNTVIGLVFIALILLSPNGLLGIPSQVRKVLKRISDRAATPSGVPAPAESEVDSL